CRIDTQLNDLSRERRDCVEVGEGCGWRGIRVVISRNVNSLNRSDRTSLGRSDSLLHFTHFSSEVRLITHGGWHAAEQRRHFRTRLSKPEDVVDKQQNVEPLITEILGYSKTRKCDTKSSAWGLSHLTVDQSYFRFANRIHI